MKTEGIRNLNSQYCKYLCNESSDLYEIKNLSSCDSMNFHKNVSEDPYMHTRVPGKNGRTCDEMCACVFFHFAYFHSFSSLKATKMDNFWIIMDFFATRYRNVPIKRGKCHLSYLVGCFLAWVVSLNILTMNLKHPVLYLTIYFNFLGCGVWWWW